MLKTKSLESLSHKVTVALFLHLVKVIKTHLESSSLINNLSKNDGGINEEKIWRLKN